MEAMFRTVISLKVAAIPHRHLYKVKTGLSMVERSRGGRAAAAAAGKEQERARAQEEEVVVVEAVVRHERRLGAGGARRAPSRARAVCVILLKCITNSEWLP